MSHQSPVFFPPIQLPPIETLRLTSPKPRGQKKRHGFFYTEKKNTSRSGGWLVASFHAKIKHRWKYSGNITDIWSIHGAIASFSPYRIGK